MREETLKYRCKMNSADCAVDKAHRKRGEEAKTSLKLLCGWKCGCFNSFTLGFENQILGYHEK